MNLLKKIIDFYIFSNIHVSLAGFFLTKITLVKFGISDNLVPIFVALSIIVSYNFIRFYEIKNSRLNWFRDWFFSHQKELLVVSILAILGLSYIILFSKFNLKSLIVLAPFALMTFFYVIPLFKVGKLEISFRNFPFIKIFSIAIAWAGIVVLFPLYEAKYTFNFNVYLEFIQRILFVIVILLPFDIRDAKVDSAALKTIPQIFGIVTSKVIGYVLLIVFIGLEFLKKEDSYLDILIILLISMITALFLRFSSPKKTRYYTSFWVELIPVVWFGLMLLFFEN
ncbi:hypothetical protein Lupro_12375 [Lutibacter profundi]|uniref:Prenyltransferase n=1 Tax=Lutibacter profundi TaxID=1622118 RepID=A0A0X8G967_9FLAO|nr:hypothetical protein [Lutibacter profundi]AMC12008.1 hypothetical protein Lupro_12375 [Lutibacter profundi]